MNLPPRIRLPFGTLAAFGRRGFLLIACAFTCALSAGGAEPLHIKTTPASRMESQEIAKTKRIPLRWQTIAASADYPADDVIVSALSVDDPRLSPALPKNAMAQDCTATVQDAIDQVWANGGGTVFIPAGEYQFNGSLIVRPRVTLRGLWSPPAANGWKTGTVLKVMTTSAAPFLTLQEDGAIQGLTFWYPGQNPDAPVPFPPTVAGLGENTIYDVSFVNSWDALSIPHAAMLVLRGAYGTAIHNGLTAGHGVAFPRFDSVNFSPHFWTWWPLGSTKVTADRKRAGSYAQHMWQNGSGVRLHEMDCCSFFNGDISGYAEGIVMEDSDGAAKSQDRAPHGTGIRVNVHDCRTALRSRIGSMEWTQSAFSGEDYGINSTEGGTVTLRESRVAGGKRAIYSDAGGKLRVDASQTSFDGTIELLGKNSIGLTQCVFSSVQPQVQAGAETTVKLHGNFNGKSPIVVRCDGHLTEDKTPAHLQALPAFGLDYRKDWNRLRKPAKPDLFNVRDSRFAGGAKGDSVADDSAAVLAALNAAKANGGGIVFFPTGLYCVRGTFEVGAGIELRGATGARHAAGTGIADATDQLMSVLLVEPNAGGREGAPLVTLGDGSGVRGLMFFYPSQNWRLLLEEKAPFAQMPFTILAKGRGNYLIHCSSPNPDQFAHFEGAISKKGSGR